MKYVFIFHFKKIFFKPKYLQNILYIQILMFKAYIIETVYHLKVKSFYLIF